MRIQATRSILAALTDEGVLAELIEQAIRDWLYEVTCADDEVIGDMIDIVFGLGMSDVLGTVGPVLVEHVKVHACKFCGFVTTIDGSRVHQGQVVCPGCWDDRLKTTE